MKISLTIADCIRAAVVCISLITPVTAEVNNHSWTRSPFDQKVFIENKGQFDKKIDSVAGEILFGTSADGVELYFGTTGLTYMHDEMIPWREEEHEAADVGEDKEGVIKAAPHFLSVEWVGVNPDMEIVPLDSVPFYYTYGEGGRNILAHAYKKLLYKNLYPGIDVEYNFPQGKEGIKYLLVVHPGADISSVKMRYHGATSLLKDQEGNIVINSPFGEFVDHAPTTVYSVDGSPISSSFVINGNEVSFNVSPYNKIQQVIIDPWVTNPSFTGYNAAYDVNYDLKGNVYVYGSHMPFKLAKIDSLGFIKWIYNADDFGKDSSLGWQVHYHYGDFAMDVESGTSYLVQGYSDETPNSHGSKVIKVNSNGFFIAMFPGDPTVHEMWRAEYNQCLNKIVIGLGSNASPKQAAILDTNMVDFMAANVLSNPDSNDCCHDMSLLAVDKNNSSCYMATSRGGGNPNNYENILMKCPLPNLLPLEFSVPHGHKLGELHSNIYVKTDKHDFVYQNANGVNGMAVSSKWLYTYDSDSLKRWDKNTGAFIAGIHVSSRQPRYLAGANVPIILVPWSGISVDECDNIYMGVMDSVKHYNSSLSLLNTIAMPDSVYDVKLGVNKLYACGRGFVSQINVASNNTIAVLSTPATCDSCNGTASVNAVNCAGTSSGFSYSWNTVPVQTTETATGLCPGTYTVTVLYRCLPIYTDSVTVDKGGDTTCRACFSPQVSHISGMKPGEVGTVPIFLTPSTRFSHATKLDLDVQYNPSMLRILRDPTSSVGTVTNIKRTEGELSFTIDALKQLDVPQAEVASLDVEALLSTYAVGTINVASSFIILQSGERVTANNCPAQFYLDSACIKPSDVHARSSAEIIGIYPNPASSQLSIEMVLQGNPQATIDVYDTFGRYVETIYNGVLLTSKSAFTFAINKYANGMYFCRLLQPGRISVKEFYVSH